MVANTHLRAIDSVSAEILAESHPPMSDEEIVHQKIGIGVMVDTINGISANTGGMNTSVFSVEALVEMVQSNLTPILSANANPTWYSSNSSIASAVSTAKTYITNNS
jgi:hypothetical protein